MTRVEFQVSKKIEDNPLKPYEKYLRENERKAVGIFVSKTKTNLGKNILDMKIFGSKIRGDFDEESDIDIILVVRNRNLRVREYISEIASDLNLEFDCMLSPLIYTKAEYNRNRRFKNLFAENLTKEGIQL
jgi:predicted nucleotidyltransferase